MSYKHHRIDKEHFISVDSAGIKCWYKNGKLHREDGPAVIDEAEDHYIAVLEWYKNGNFIRSVNVHKDQLHAILNKI